MGVKMKTNIEVKPGAFTAEGDLLEPAHIILTLYELDLPEYKKSMSILSKEFDVDYTSSVFRQNRSIVVSSPGEIHDARCPVEGNRTRM